MAPFHLPEDESRMDWWVLRDGAIAMYWRPEYLKEDIAWLRQQKYQVFSFDCETWSSDESMHINLQRVLALPEWYGKNFDALNDCLTSEDVVVPDAGGTVIVLNRFDAYAGGPSGQRDANILLSIFARSSRYFLLTGKRLLIFVQSDDPQIHFDGLGCVAATWNSREWLNEKRGL
jgi:Barstar (barnase inhibitor)